MNAADHAASPILSPSIVDNLDFDCVASHTRYADFQIAHGNVRVARSRSDWVSKPLSGDTTMLRCDPGFPAKIAALGT